MERVLPHPVYREAMGSREVLFLLFLALAVPAVTTVPVAGQAVEPTAQPPVAENTTLSLQLQTNGDARWRITDTYALTGANDTRAFEQLGSEYVDGESQPGWEQTFRDAHEAAETATGRSMRVTNVTRDFETTDRRGRLVLEFTWTNFARVNGSQLIVNDAFNTTDGTWLPRLYSGQTLIISAPPGYGITTSPPTDINDRSLIFKGSQTFEPGYLDIVYRGERPVPLIPLRGETLLVIGLGIVLIAGLVAVQRYRDTDPQPDTIDEPEPSTDEPEEEDVDVELLSDEEQVERLLEQNGGRMKQARIVDETGWSNAKVSQLLSSMEEDGRIDKLRIGRENLISFPDEDVTGLDDE
jgi:uncharacterized membrane protein